MNDEQFKNFLSLIAYQHGLGYWGEQLFARDNAQREAQAQLAEAVELLRQLGRPGPVTLGQVQKISDFLVRHDQAEQQCQMCEPAGVFATDGTGPYDCYECGKKAEQAAAHGDEAVFLWLPNEKHYDHSDGPASRAAKFAWNNCIAEIKELNPGMIDIVVNVQDKV